MTDQNTLAVLEAAIEKNPLALKEALETALSARITDALDRMRASMFSEDKDCDCDDEDKSDDDSDKKDDDEDEDLDEALESIDEETISDVMDSILEAAAEEGVELSEEELVELSKDTLKSYLVKSVTKNRAPAKDSAQYLSRGKAERSAIKKAS